MTPLCSGASLVGFLIHPKFEPVQWPRMGRTSMPTRDAAPLGAPCWTDLWTSDVEGSQRFYTELFGWEAQEPSAEFGGYFMFTLDGVPVAGGMGDMGDMAADNRWKIYLATDDISRTVRDAEANGGTIFAPSMEVADAKIPPQLATADKVSSVTA